MNMFKKLTIVVLCPAVTAFWSGIAVAGNPNHSGDTANTQEGEQKS